MTTPVADPPGTRDAPPPGAPPKRLLPWSLVPAPGDNDTADDDTLTDTPEPSSVSALDAVAPQLFVVMECARPEAGGSRHALRAVDQVLLGRGEGRGSLRAGARGLRTLELRVPDRHVSAAHARIVRRGTRFYVEDAGSHNGTRVNGATTVEETLLEDGDIIQAGHTLLRYRSAVTVPPQEPADVDVSPAAAEASLLPTLDPVLARRAAMLVPMASAKSPVLLLGETGTGKELLARAIHRASGRRGPFIAVNCGALPATLVESQLFGHVRGAFSGAVADTPGFLRSADRGTLLLDEIGDLPASAQAALLRALQEGDIVPIGSSHAVRVDLRIIAATHRPLATLVARGEFRRDLYARLAGFTFQLPPVRERQEDIGLFVGAFAAHRRIRLTPVAGRALLRYGWPHNVRELHHTLEVAATLARNESIRLAHLPAEVADGLASRASTPPEEPDTILREDLLESLARHDGNVSEVARDLGKHRRQVQRWLSRLSIDARTYRAR